MRKIYAITVYLSNRLCIIWTCSCMISLLHQGRKRPSNSGGRVIAPRLPCFHRTCNSIVLKCLLMCFVKDQRFAELFPICQPNLLLHTLLFLRPFGLFPTYLERVVKKKDQTLPPSGVYVFLLYMYLFRAFLVKTVVLQFVNRICSCTHFFF